MTYRQAGVDKEKGYEHVHSIKDMIQKTHSKHVLNQIGAFSALFVLPEGYEKPVLVSGTDGIGTKVKLASDYKIYDTVGIDCVAMCVNDVLCHGAKPLYFLDYLAVGKLDPVVSKDLVKGVSNGCLQAKASLIGGETAEMPGVYAEDDFDMAGFCVGIVEKDKQIDGSNIKEGDVIIALPSTGVHSNGFSLVRHIFDEEAMDKYHKTLFTPTKIYVNDILKLMEHVTPHGLAHITGGGLIENVPRILPKNTHAKIDRDKIKVLDIFKTIQSIGNIETDEMFGTFNMGVGFVIVVDKKDVDQTLSILDDGYVIGEIITQDTGITL